MALLANEFYHIYNQGNNRQPIFFKHDNYIYFLRRFREQVAPYCEVISYCLMPNHFHFLLYTNEKSVKLLKNGNLEVSVLHNGFRLLQSSYAQAINKQKNRTGSLFRQRTKTKLVEQNQGSLFRLFHYIHQNPLRAGLTERLENWEFSSFQDFANMRKGTLCNKELAKKYLDFVESNFVTESHLLIKPSDVMLYFV